MCHAYIRMRLYYHKRTHARTQRNKRNALRAHCDWNAQKCIQHWTDSMNIINKYARALFFRKHTLIGFALQAKYVSSIVFLVLSWLFLHSIYFRFSFCAQCQHKNKRLQLLKRLDCVLRAGLRSCKSTFSYIPRYDLTHATIVMYLRVSSVYQQYFLKAGIHFCTVSPIFKFQLVLSLSQFIYSLTCK